MGCINCKKHKSYSNKSQPNNKNASTSSGDLSANDSVYKNNGKSNISSRSTRSTDQSSNVLIRENSTSRSSTSGTDEDIGYALVRAQSRKVTKDDFELLHVIGRGSFGKVMQVRCKFDGKIYAMKVMRKDAIITKKQATHTKDEKNILQSINHQFIVKLNYAFQTKDKLYMILDCINGGELFYHLKKETRFSEARVRIYAAEISSALLHLHSHGIIYRDLKPENILLDATGHIVITDFGLSKEVPKDDETHTFCGTPEYLAPEVLRNQGHSYPVDWWSLGTLIYEMLTGLPPFYSKHINVMYQKILSADLSFPPNVSKEAQSLLSGLLTRDPEKRLGGPAIKKHPFFNNLNWDDLEAKKIPAPWVPDVKDAMDITQIDELFTLERISDSQDENFFNEMDDYDKNIFEGFTFARDAPLGK